MKSSCGAGVPTYLSVDLDYWARTRASPVSFLRKVFDVCSSVAVVDSHEELLPHVDWCGESLGCRRLLNVDMHSDFPGDCKHLCHHIVLPELKLDEGTWCEFVSWRGDGHFEWRRPRVPNSLFRGVCHGGGCDPFLSGHHGWLSASRSLGLGSLPWDDVVAAGISLSWEWLSDDSPERASELKQQAESIDGAETVASCGDIRLVRCTL